MTEAALSLPDGYRLHFYETIGSTNDEAKRLVRTGAAEGTLVWAGEQTAGRGRRGRRWASPPGNLYLSLVMRPGGAPGRAAQLGLQTECEWKNSRHPRKTSDLTHAKKYPAEA
jgi:BirA family transcriptional regulator, biotin operon repressor / biotin---[acetyl-CoA-carboxylase] ligase